LLRICVKISWMTDNLTWWLRVRSKLIHPRRRPESESVLRLRPNKNIYESPHSSCLRNLDNALSKLTKATYFHQRRSFQSSIINLKQWVNHHVQRITAAPVLAAHVSSLSHVLLEQFYPLLLHTQKSTRLISRKSLRHSLPLLLDRTHYFLVELYSAKVATCLDATSVRQEKLALRSIYKTLSESIREG